MTDDLLNCPFAMDGPTKLLNGYEMAVGIFAT